MIDSVNTYNVNIASRSVYIIWLQCGKKKNDGGNGYDHMQPRKDAWIQKIIGGSVKEPEKSKEDNTAETNHF